MDAISYLIGRKSKSPYLLSGILLAATLLVFAGHKLIFFLDGGFALAPTEGLIGALAGFFWFLVCTALSLWAGVLFLGIPTYLCSNLNGLLRSWSENRVLEELSSTGLSHQVLVDSLLRYHLQRWLIIAGPTALFAWLVADSSNELSNPWLWLAYTVIALSLFMGAFCLNCWQVAVARRFYILMLLPVALLIGPPALAAELEVFGPSDQGFVMLTLLSALYVILFSRYSSIRILVNGPNVDNLSWNFRKKSTVDKKSGPSLSENPIVSRHEMLGRGFVSVLSVLFVLSMVLWTCSVSLEAGKPTAIYFGLLLAGFIAACKAGDQLSQCLTCELESSRLEILQSTPMGSARFLQGWLHIAIRPLVQQMLGLVALATPVVWYLGGMDAMADGRYIQVGLIALSAPYLGGLLGATMAGRCKPRHEVQNQFVPLISLVGLVTLGQVGINLMEGPTQVWFSTATFFAVLLFAKWVLNAGAQRSLDRVFLPQK